VNEEIDCPYCNGREAIREKTSLKAFDYALFYKGLFSFNVIKRSGIMLSVFPEARQTVETEIGGGCPSSVCQQPAVRKTDQGIPKEEDSFACMDCK
jgi:hypothetical protein